MVESGSLMSNNGSFGSGEVLSKVSVVDISAEAASVLNKPLFLCFSMLWTAKMYIQMLVLEIDLAKLSILRLHLHGNWILLNHTKVIVKRSQHPKAVYLITFSYMYMVFPETNVQCYIQGTLQATTAHCG